jgi:uncharacterized protein
VNYLIFQTAKIRHWLIICEDFHSQSDIDLLIAFQPASGWRLLEHVQMQQELQDILGRDVDLVSKRAIDCSTAL